MLSSFCIYDSSSSLYYDPSVALAPYGASSASTHGGILTLIVSTLFSSRLKIPEPSIPVIFLAYIEHLKHPVDLFVDAPCSPLLVIVKQGFLNSTS